MTASCMHRFQRNAHSLVLQNLQQACMQGRENSIIHAWILEGTAQWFGAADPAAGLCRSLGTNSIIFVASIDVNAAADLRRR